MAKTICLYVESKEKIDFKKISSFVEDYFGFASKVKKLKEAIVQTKGLLYDPVGSERLFENIKFKRSDIDILITDKLIATYEESDRRLHLRAAIFGFPSVTSTSCIVEAPAKPKEYYLAKQKYSLLKAWELKEKEVKQKFKDSFIDYHDPRLTEVLKGYIAQAIFFELVGNPFCGNKSCRLFNAHWQEDLIRAQIKSGKFCKRHSLELLKIKEGDCHERKS
ncbi:MAG: hypothetical protein A3J51_04645 [Omnitrophica WOR_2 bacterium RIFCSPHIGHO2_02_FULL_45_21]|nr:MAG: hypothetical protein A3J51_04645 [Omnitrophica WOR_2 bacterium RIFCSPHIGHO2_02_FULL_45_21]